MKLGVAYWSKSCSVLSGSKRVVLMLSCISVAVSLLKVGAEACLSSCGVTGVSGS